MIRCNIVDIKFFQSKAAGVKKFQHKILTTLLNFKSLCPYANSCQKTINLKKETTVKEY